MIQVTVPTAPFDLGNGQHGVIVEGEVDPATFSTHGGSTGPPKWVLDALQPCECHGDGEGDCCVPTKHPTTGDDDYTTGKRVVELQTPKVVNITPYDKWHWYSDRERLGPQDCGHFEDCEMYEGDTRCRYAGCSYEWFVSAGRWTVTEVLPIVGWMRRRDTPVPYVGLAPNGSWLVRVEGDDPEATALTIPGDPADLPGNYLVIVRDVEEPRPVRCDD